MEKSYLDFRWVLLKCLLLMAAVYILNGRGRLTDTKIGELLLNWEAEIWPSVYQKTVSYTLEEETDAFRLSVSEIKTTTKKKDDFFEKNKNDDWK